MSGEIVIRAENLGKLYRIGQREPFYYSTLRDTLARGLRRSAAIARRAIGREEGPQGRYSDSGSNSWIWALKEVSFEVKRGEAVGIIGRNGAGKSTLLKILARITEPTEGRAEILGRVGSLLEVGTGFHPELTGRENVYLNGAILGMRKAEIDRKLEEIVAFAELEKFIDTPVKRYSSGMYVRLAFAVAAHLEPEILLVDEVLAVGDAAFQQKCLGKMGDVTRQGRTVLFVSHNMGAVMRLCQSTLLLEHGQLSANGSTDHMVARYLYNGATRDRERTWEGGIANAGVSELRIRSVRIKDESGAPAGALDVRKPFRLEIEHEILDPMPVCRVGIVISTYDGTIVLESYDSDDENDSGKRDPGAFLSSCEVPGNLLSPGRYFLSVNAGVPGLRNLARLENIMSFDIEDTGAVGSHIGGKRSGIIRPRLPWERRIL